jgi:ABC-type polar amino acid transport system ATPase subunit
MMSPAVLLLDEPTSALDHQMQLEVCDIIKELHKAGITMVIITHDTLFAESVATRVVQMKNGKFV